MATKDTNLNDAYKTSQTAEKKLVTDLEAAVETFKAAIDELLAPFPVEANTALAVQVAQRVKSNLVGSFSYDLMNAKTTYGLNESGTPLVPVPTV